MISPFPAFCFHSFLPIVLSSLLAFSLHHSFIQVFTFSFKRVFNKKHAYFRFRFAAAANGKMENRIIKIRPVLRRSLVESAQDENSDWTGWIRKTLLRGTNDGCWVPCERIELEMVAFWNGENFRFQKYGVCLGKYCEKSGQFRNLKPCEIVWEKNPFPIILFRMAWGFQIAKSVYHTPIHRQYFAYKPMIRNIHKCCANEYDNPSLILQNPSFIYRSF